MKYYLAIDIGAGSGRHIIGWKNGTEILTDEVYRFENHIDSKDGKLTWDTDRLFVEIKKGIAKAFEKYPTIESLAIDTWGVDYVLLKGDRPVYPVYAYRDDRTRAVIEKVHGIVSFDALYAKTGIQFVEFNSIYQLYCDKISGRLDGVTDMLMLPEYFNYLLTGNKVKEYTNATTTGLVNAESREFDRDIVRALGYPEGLFAPLCQPGTVVGELTDEVAAECGGKTKVLLCPSHDTASAYDAVDNEEDSVFISSGTWSLVGAKLKKPATDAVALKNNFTNEGGVGYIRFLKNITGMWINMNLQKQFGRSFSVMTEMAEKSDFDGLFDVCDPSLTAPENMKEALDALFARLGKPAPVTEGDYYRTAYRSLAACYAKVCDEIEESARKKFNKIYIVGGGAKNALLNRFTEEFTGRPVVALPIEATAIGNLKCQMK